MTKNEERGPWLSWVGLAAWCGLVAGLAEAVLLVARVHFFAPDGLLRRNPHFPWMMPLANLVIFGVAGLLLTASARLAGQVGRLAADHALCALALLAPLLAVPGLGLAGSATLAVGLSCWTVPALRSPRVRFGRLVRATFPVVVITVLGLAFVDVRSGSTLAAAPRANGVVPPAGAPNVVLIVMDTVRADATSLDGGRRATTPNLARLACGGVRYDRAIATAPWTLPSHASMFTGQWPSQLNVGPDRALGGRSPTLAEYLRSRGYATAGFVANTIYCSREYGLARGFEHYEDYVISPLEIARSSSLGWLICKRVGVVLDRVNAGLRRPPRHPLEQDFYRKDATEVNASALRWIGRQRDRPFYVFLNYFDVHDPYLLPDGAAYRFGGRPLSLAEARVLRGGTTPSRAVPGAESIERMRDAYDSCLGFLDQQLGCLFDELGRLGRLENTVIIITADHGEHFGEHRGDGRPLLGHSLSLYQPEIHVPLLIVAPGRVAPAGVVRRPASLRDLPATIVELAGLNGGSPFPGRSLVAERSAGGEERLGPDGDAAVAELVTGADHCADRRRPSVANHARAVVADSTVYLRHADSREELYDLDSDPGEQHDLAANRSAQGRLEWFRRTLARLVPASATR